MPKKFGKTMEQISYNCPSDLLTKLNEETSKGNYSSRSEFITTAIRFYLKNRDKKLNLREELKQYLESSEGEELVAKIVRKNP